ncbi:MAG: VOC family protein [Acidobacteriia bacterium]|nr:VOC family protein [Terriglobia bacterium]
MRVLILTVIFCATLSAQLPDFYQSLPHLFWVVDDVERVAAAWKNAGIPHEGDTAPLSATGVQFRGRQSNHSFRTQTGRFANVRADWIQPVSGDSAWAEFLKRRGPGIFALVYRAPSKEALETETGRLRSLGVSIMEEGIFELDDNRKVPYVFFDTEAQGKICLGLLYDPEPEQAPAQTGPPVTQFALTARDLDTVSAFWQKLGFPPFSFTHPEITGKVYRGAPGIFDMRLGWQRHLKVPFEWIQPLQGPNVYEDHIAKHGEGFHHIAFNVPDMDQAVARWNAFGFPVSMSGGWGETNTPGSGRFAYHDTHTIGGIDVELLWSYRAPAILPAPAPLNFTFRRGEAAPEFRIPVTQLSWPRDWRAWKAIRFEFDASSLEAFSVGFSDGSRVKSMIVEPLPGLRIRAVIPFDAFYQTRQMVPQNPLGYKAWPQRLFTFEKVEELVFRMKQPAVDAKLAITNLALVSAVENDGILDRKPVIDRFGQWMAEDWPGKAHSAEELRTLWDGDRLQPVSFPFCPLGGDSKLTRNATGFFRTDRIDGRWYFVDPHGHPFYSAGMDLVNLTQGSFATRVTGREFLYEQLPPPGAAWLSPGKDVSFHLENVMMRYGDDWLRRWPEDIVKRLKNWGFNTIANWADTDLATSSGMPYVLPLSGWTTKKTFPFPWDFPDVFSAEFERNVDEAARKQCAPLKDDPNLIGWFLGNEPHWAREFGSLKPWAVMLLEDPDDSATKQALQQLLAANPAQADQIKRDFVFTCGRRYLEVITRAVRRHDPNHLVLGIRFAGSPDDEWVRLSSLFDVFSINIYAEQFAPDHAKLDRFARLSGRPILIGEFTACAPGRGLQGLFYWVHKVKDQPERGKAYRYYVETAASHPAMIGTHWFQLVDNLPTGRPSDQERLNYGFLNVLDLPYVELVEAARQTHRRLYDIKSGRVDPVSVKPQVY